MSIIDELRKLSNCCKSLIEQDIGKNTCLNCGKDCDWTYDYPKKNMSISKIKEIIDTKMVSRKGILLGIKEFELARKKYKLTAEEELKMLKKYLLIVV